MSVILQIFSVLSHLKQRLLYKIILFRTNFANFSKKTRVSDHYLLPRSRYENIGSYTHTFFICDCVSWSGCVSYGLYLILEYYGVRIKVTIMHYVITWHQFFFSQKLKHISMLYHEYEIKKRNQNLNILFRFWKRNIFSSLPYSTISNDNTSKRFRTVKIFKVVICKGYQLRR